MARLCRVMFLCFMPLWAVNASDNVRIDLPEVRKKAPAFSIQHGEQQFSLADDARRLVILNFWSIDCKPCREEMASLDALASKYQGLDVVAISINDTWEAILQYKNKFALGLPLFADENRKIRHSYEVDVLPLTYLIGEDGKFIGRIVGARDWMHPEMQLFIGRFLNR